MKTLCLLALVAARFVSAQDHYVWIGLTQNRVYPNARLESVQETSVMIEVGHRLIKVRLAEIEQTREIKSGAITKGAIAGGGAGFVLGGVAGLLGSPRENRNVKIGTTALAGAVLGAIVGTILETAPAENEIIDFRGKTPEEKRKIFEGILIGKADEKREIFD